MKNVTETITQNPERALYGKVFGVVKYRYQLKFLCESLTLLGVHEVDVLNGPGGTTRLETWNQAVPQFFFGDMEGEMLRRYLDAIADDLIVFAAVVVGELAHKAADAAKKQGASDVVYFGNSVVTNY